MTAIWDKFVAILVETLNLYQVLLDLAQKKREILVKAKPRDLEAITKQEEAIVLQAGKIGAIRSNIILEIANLLGMQNKDMTLSLLIEHADSNYAQQLIDISGKLDKVLQELARLNKLNVELIQQSLNFVNYNINILAQTTSEQTYAPRGQASQPGKSRAIIDAKV